MAALEVTLTVEDQIAFNLFLVERPFFRRRRWRRAATLVAAGIAGPWIGALAAGWRFESWLVSALWPVSAGVAALGAAWLVALPRLTRWHMARTVRRWIASGPQGATTGPATVEALPEGLLVRSSAQETRLSWTAVTHAAETPHHLILLMGEASGVVVPKRGVQPEAWRGFLGEISARTGLPITPARG
jgi:hypothetical protein